MADVTQQSPSLDQMVGGPTDAKIGLGGGVKIGGFVRISGNETVDANTRVAPNVTPAGKG